MPNPTTAGLLSGAEGAILAAAVGDALGWPQEDRGRRTRAPARAEPKLDFFAWWRREGGRYAAHEAEIGPGEYSDDTQLILALAHALRAKDHWWERWTSVELPFWLLYERGGGAATKGAARSWRAERPPWLQDNPSSYFEAGGNGVAMRVLPHCVHGAGNEDFGPIASDIVRDGIATHGHPVALVGALAYAYALWQALRLERALEYGELIAETNASVGTWSQLPEDLPATWREAAELHNQGEYLHLWGEAVGSMVELLTLSEAAIGQGSLSVDRETLENLGAFDKRRGGAGTVTAAGALFLASRYASRPAQGIVASAFSHGADTDTLASMAGGLLGAVNGPDWLRGIAPKVQDYDHLKAAARALVVPRDEPILGETPSAVRKFSRRQVPGRVGEEIPLPDGRRGVIARVHDLPTKTRNEIRTFVIRTDDDQTLHITKRRRTHQPPSDTEKGTERGGLVDKKRVRREPRIAYAIETANLEASTRFYRDLIGLNLTRRTSEFVVFGEALLLVPVTLKGDERTPQLRLGANASSAAPTRLLIFLAPTELEALRARMIEAKARVSPVTTVRPLGRFTCLDPDGTVIEICEASDALA